jgi:hypothetical protein
MPALLACAVALVVTPSASSGIPPLRGHVKLDINGTVLDTYTYKPPHFKGDRMILVFHGVLRNADVYREHAVEMGKRFNALIVTPKFDAERFPTRRYQYGGILNADRTAAPASEWTYAMIPKIVERVREMEGRPTMPYYLIGHSADGQFLVRMSAFMQEGASAVVAANPGSHLFPTRERPFGYGFGNLPEELSSDEVMRKYLAQPLTLLLGTADDKPDENFDSSPEAMRQGPGRYQRGKAAFEFAKNVAKEKGWAFNWRLIEVPGIAHDHEKMFNAAQTERALFGR